MIGKKLLIIGEVGRGKTRLTAELLEKLANELYPKDVTVIDMTPTKVAGIANRLPAYTNTISKVMYLTPPLVRAPRIEGKERGEVIYLANFNKNSIEPLIQSFLKQPTPVLIIDNLSIYLHAGDVSKIFDCMDVAKTFIANSYYGTSLSDDKNSGITERERKLIDRLIEKSDTIIRL